MNISPLDQLVEQAFGLHMAGRWAEAEKLYRRVLASDPNHPDALHLLGALGHQTGHDQDAHRLIARAIALRGNVSEYHNNHGEVLRALGRPFEAVAAYEKAYQLNPRFAAACSNLCGLLRMLDRLEEATMWGRKAIELAPNDPSGHHNLGTVLYDGGRADEALDCYRRAMELDPRSTVPVGAALTALTSLRRIDEAIAFCDSPSAMVDPPRAHNNRGQMLLLAGRFEEGWKEYEWRWQCHDFTSLKRNFPQPQWDGGDPRGRTILVHTEQGLGDAIQFIRYAPLLSARGANVIVECQEEVRTLLGSAHGVDRVFPRGASLPPFDAHIPMLSLPRIFGTTLATVPASVPYLSVDADALAAWRARLAGSGLAVGLCWSGNPTHRNDRYRSIPLPVLAPVLQVQGVRFVSLQKQNNPSAEADPAMPADLSAELTDFAATAAAIANLDLVITVDTAIAHLAGALAKPTWTLLAAVPDWRWMLDRTDSPWYPTMRLFRQRLPRQWGEVMQNVAKELAELAQRYIRRP